MTHRVHGTTLLGPSRNVAPWRGRSRGSDPEDLGMAKEGAPRSWRQVTSAFLTAWAERGVAVSTLGMYRQDLRWWTEVLRVNGRPPRLQDIDPERIQVLLDASPDAVNTLRRHLSTLRLLLRWATAQGWTHYDEDPYQLIYHNLGQPVDLPRDWWDHADAGWFIAHLPQNSERPHRDDAMGRVLIQTGIRLNELIDLNRADWDRVHHLMGTHGKGSARHLGEPLPRRILPLDPATETALGRYLDTRRDDHPALFVTPQGTRWSPSGIQKWFHRRLISMGHPHSNVSVGVLRTYAMCAALGRGASVENVQRWAGIDKRKWMLRYRRWAEWFGFLTEPRWERLSRGRPRFY